jgi:hypothetical protein
MHDDETVKTHRQYHHDNTNTKRTTQEDPSQQGQGTYTDTRISSVRRGHKKTDSHRQQEKCTLEPEHSALSMHQLLIARPLGTAQPPP